MSLPASAPLRQTTSQDSATSRPVTSVMSAEPRKLLRLSANNITGQCHVTSRYVGHVGRAAKSLAMFSVVGETAIIYRNLSLPASAPLRQTTSQGRVTSRPVTSVMSAEPRKVSQCLVLSGKLPLFTGTCLSQLLRLSAKQHHRTVPRHVPLRRSCRQSREKSRNV
ncbi:hypothetical protein J6590_067982 [Homalodisca vitripennis]|nr:hypothetical protein J6590_067982 [Homalodisca vitripennis]